MLSIKFVFFLSFKGFHYRFSASLFHFTFIILWFFSIHLFGLWELLEEEEREAFLTRNFLLISWNRNQTPFYFFCNIFTHTVTGFINILWLKYNICFDCVHSLLLFSLPFSLVSFFSQIVLYLHGGFFNSYHNISIINMIKYEKMDECGLFHLIRSIDLSISQKINFTFL